MYAKMGHTYNNQGSMKVKDEVAKAPHPENVPEEQK